MITIDLTPEELIMLIQGINSRKKIFKGKIRNNEKKIEDGTSVFTDKQINDFITKRKQQLEEMDVLHDRLKTTAFCFGIKTDNRDGAIYYTPDCVIELPELAIIGNPPFEMD